MITGTRYYDNEMMFVKDVAYVNGAMVFILSAPVDDGDDIPCETSIQKDDLNELPTWWIKRAYSLQDGESSLRKLIIRAVKGEMTYVPNEWLEEKEA